MTQPPATSPSSATPAVSVITATRNRPLAWVKRAMDSIAAQTLTDFESILIDDGSSAAVLAEQHAMRTGLDSRFIVVPPTCPDAPGTGPSAARNRGLARARGAFVAFCDDDDHWLAPNHLEVGVHTLDRHGGDFFFANMRGENGDRVTIPNWFPDSPRLTAGRQVAEQPAVFEVSLAALTQVIRHHYPHPNGCIIRRSLLDKVGHFWEKIGYTEDLDLMLRVADQSRKIFYRPEPAVGFNVTPRDSAFGRTPIIERSAQMVAMAQHVRYFCTRRETRACARALEAWALRMAAEALQGDRRSKRAVTWAWQALAVYPSPGTARFCLKSILKALGGS